jgi:hypothetical protein
MSLPQAVGPLGASAEPTAQAVGRLGGKAEPTAQAVGRLGGKAEPRRSSEERQRSVPKLSPTHRCKFIANA